MSVLVLIEHNNQNLKASSLNTITAAKKIDKSVHAVILGENCSKIAVSFLIWGSPIDSGNK